MSFYCQLVPYVQVMRSGDFMYGTNMDGCMLWTAYPFIP